MAGSPQRYLEKFESADAVTSLTFPLRLYEYQPEQGYRRGDAPVVGADYAVDFAAGAAWPKDVAQEAVRFMVVGTSQADADSQFDACVQKARNIGLGKLYQLDSAAVRRWCWAKLMGRPSYVVDGNQSWTIPVAMRFARYSDWFASSATTGSRTISATPDTFTINNPGNAPARFIVFRLRANGATGFTNPSLTNLTNGYAFSSTRDAASADSELKVDTERAQVLWSDSNGSSYADDYALFTMGATQVGFMQLEPGDNTLRYVDGGTPDASLEWSFYAPNH